MKQRQLQASPSKTLKMWVIISSSEILSLSVSLSCPHDLLSLFLFFLVPFFPSLSFSLSQEGFLFFSLFLFLSKFRNFLIHRSNCFSSYRLSSSRNRKSQHLSNPSSFPAELFQSFTQTKMTMTILLLLICMAVIEMMSQRFFVSVEFLHAAKYDRVIVSCLEGSFTLARFFSSKLQRFRKLSHLSFGRAYRKNRTSLDDPW